MPVFIRRVIMLALPLWLAACSESYPMQKPVHDLGAAINHCREYTQYMLPPEAVISLDALSTRQGKYFYDVFFSVRDHKESGYVRCQINMDGMIVYFNVRDFRQRSRSFSDFAF